MSLTLQQTPERSMGSILAEPQLSFWIATAPGNPHIFRFQRKDVIVDEVVVAIGGGSADVSTNTSGAFAGVVAGDYVYVSSNSVNFLAGTFEVFSSDGDDDLVILLPGGYAAGTYSGGFINLVSTRKNYYVECIIKIQNNAGTAYSELATTQYTPSPEGELVIDPSAWIRRTFEIVDEMDHEALFSAVYAIKDTGLCTVYNLFYTEVWDGSDEDEEEIYDFFAVNAARQIRDHLGQNMGDYVPHPTLANHSAKFLNRMAEPVYWLQFPFDLGFLWSEYIDSTKLGRRITEYDHAKVALPSPAEHEIEPIAFRGVARVVLEYQPVNQEARYQEIQLFDLDTDDLLTEALRVKFPQDETPCNPVYLKWLNTLGGYSYWCFEFNQFKKLKTGDAVLFQKTLEDLETAESSLEFLSKKAFPAMTIGAENIPIGNYTAIEEILYSPKVQWLSNPFDWIDDGEKWITCLIETGSFNTVETRDEFADIEFTIQFPEIFVQVQ